jgi:NAD(P)-dependent dehydrogenase (short-subunit alcohol dehydrogenase family)
MPKEDNSSLGGRVALVTGASSGIGARFCEVLVAHGARVVATARRADRLEQLRSKLGTNRVEVMALDITSSGAAEAVVEAAMRRYGRLDVLVNNAGINRSLPAEDETPEAFVEVLAVNLVAVFACARAAFAAMRDNGGGSIVNVSSALGLVGIGRIPQASYCAAKGGVVNLTRELAAQWARHGVRVNSIAPGWFPTEMTTEMMDERGLRYIARTVPAGRAGELAELDAALLFLAGDGSAYVTGQTIAVDGGWTSV